MYNLFTCGELNSIVFKSDSFSSANEIMNNLGEPIYLNNNSKKTRNNSDKKGEFKIKSNARIMKLDINKDNINKIFDHPNDMKNIFEKSESGEELKLTERIMNIMEASKMDGVYWADSTVDKLQEYYPEFKDDLEKFRNNVIVFYPSIIVNKKDYTQEKIDRKLKIGDDAKQVFSYVHHYNDYLYEIATDNDMHALDFKTDSNGNFSVINTKNNIDMTEKCKLFVEDMKEELTNMYEDLKKEYPELESTPLLINTSLYPDGKNGYDHYLSEEGFSKFGSINISPITGITRYYSLMNSELIPEDIKGQLNMRDIVKSTFYNEVGHAVNTDYFGQTQALNELIGKNTLLSGSVDIDSYTSNVKKIFSHLDKPKKNAIDFALKKMPGNTSAGLSLAVNFAEHHKKKLMTLEDVYYDNYPTISVNNTKVTFV